MKSDAEWYFEQSRKNRMYYYVFFTLLKHYGIALWSQATPEQKNTISVALKKALDYLERQNIEWTNLSSEEKERWMEKAMEIL